MASKGFWQGTAQRRSRAARLASALVTSLGTAVLVYGCGTTTEPPADAGSCSLIKQGSPCSSGQKCWTGFNGPTVCLCELNGLWSCVDKT
jgi:hypothetical protein